jgi:hypothetical protein
MRRLRLLVPCGLALALGVQAAGAKAATLAVCRPTDISGPRIAALKVPAASLFRDNGRADDPLVEFTRDYWQLRLETINDAVIPALQQCVMVLVRITSDSSVKAVGVGDNRRFIYAGSNNLLDQSPPSEELLTLIGVVLDQVP